MKLVKYCRVPANWLYDSTWTHEAVTAKDLPAQLAFDKKWRWGQSIFVDGKCVHVSDVAGHSPDDIEAIEARLSVREVACMS